MNVRELRSKLTKFNQNLPVALLMGTHETSSITIDLITNVDDTFTVVLMDEDKA